MRTEDEIKAKIKALGEKYVELSQEEEDPFDGHWRRTVITDTRFVCAQVARSNLMLLKWALGEEGSTLSDLGAAFPVPDIEEETTWTRSHGGGSAC